MLSASGGLKALLDGVDERGLVELRRLLAMRVDELNHEQLSNLVSARHQLANRASELSSGLAKARLVLRSLDGHLAELEAAAEQSQSAESIRLALDGFEAIYRVVGSLPELEQAMLQLVTDGESARPLQPRSNGRPVESRSSSAQEAPTVEAIAGSAKPAPSPGPAPEVALAAADPAPGVGLNVFDTALDRLRRSRAPGAA